MISLLEVLGRVAEDVRASAHELNALDGAAGDGDLGVTMTAASSTVLELLPELDGQPAGAVLRSCGARIARDAPSTSGTLVATALLAAGKAAADSADIGLAGLLRAAGDGIAQRGGASPGEKTMLDALAPAAEAAALGEQDGLAASLRLAADAARAGAETTATMVPKHGRAGWLAERSAGNIDAGARLVAIALDSAATAVAYGS